MLFGFILAISGFLVFSTSTTTITQKFHYDLQKHGKKTCVMNVPELILVVVVFDCEYMKIIYVNCGLRNVYESDLHSNKHY